MPSPLQGTIIQLNLSSGGLPKRPVAAAYLTPLGFQGDAVAHPSIHGGPRKAVLLVAREAIALLVERGFPLFNGALGENLTTEGLDFREWRAGQRSRIGEAAVELTTPRRPCDELDIYGAALQKELSVPEALGLAGHYASVVRVGWVRTNDIISLADISV